MNTRTYILDSNSLAAEGVSIFEVGRTNIIIDFSSIHNSGAGYLKFVVDFGDGTDDVIVDNITDTWGLSGRTVSRILNTSTKSVTEYNMTVRGIKTDLSVDEHKLNVRIGKPSVTAYKDIKIINSHLYTTPAGKNNLMLTVEAQDPHFIGNICIPYDKYNVDEFLAARDSVLQPLDLEVYLRTEVYSAVGGLQAIVTERSGSYIYTEDRLLVLVIGNEILSQWTGQTSTDESIAIILDDSATMTDINGNTITPDLILVPEYDTPGNDYQPKTGLAYR